jgi:hypothetical protein
MACMSSGSTVLSVGSLPGSTSASRKIHASPRSASRTSCSVMSCHLLHGLRLRATIVTATAPKPASTAPARSHVMWVLRVGSVGAAVAALGCSVGPDCSPDAARPEGVGSPDGDASATCWTAAGAEGRAVLTVGAGDGDGLGETLARGPGLGTVGEGDGAAGEGGSTMRPMAEL